MSRRKKINPAALYFPKNIQDKLDYIKNYPLTVICAPTGFGKTTALRHFISNNISREIQVIWHTFWKSQPVKSWEYFCEEFGKIDVRCADGLLGIGVPDEDVLPIAAELLENLECGKEIYLILDNFDDAELPEPEQLIRILSRHGGEKLHIVIVSREIPVDRIISSHRIFKLDASDFVFSSRDAEKYFRQVGIDVTEKTVLDSYKVSNGWILALHLQALAYLETGNFTSGNIYQLMEQAIWERLSDKERSFFLQISIFPRFTISQAIQASEMGSGSTETLLRRYRAFICLDMGLSSCCLHDAFADFLQKQFFKRSKQEQCGIYLKGAEIAMDSGDRVNMVRFYYLADAVEKLMATSLTSYEIMDIADETAKPMIMAMLDDTPYDVKLKYPTSLVPLAFALFFFNENQKLMEVQEEIQNIISVCALPEQRKNELRGEMDLLLSFLHYNRIGKMSEMHRRALKLLGGPATLISVKSAWTFGSPSVLYMYWRESGKLDEVVEQLEVCMPVYYELTQGHGYGAEIIMRAEVFFCRGDLENAEILCHRALAAAGGKEQNSICQCAFFLLARIAVMHGDEYALNEAMQSMVKSAQRSSEDLCRYTLDLAAGFLAALTENIAIVPKWLLKGKITERRLVIMTQPFAYIIYGRCLLQQKEYLKMLGVSHEFMEKSSIAPNLLPVLYCKIYLAQALEALGRGGEARAELQTALDIAVPDRMYLPFAENYEGICNMLEGVVKGTGAPDIGLIKRLASDLKASRQRIDKKKPSLTPREREIYELAKKGLNNKEIAEKLCITNSTVKNHFAKIYSKAGVSTKAQLVLLDI